MKNTIYFFISTLLLLVTHSMSLHAKEFSHDDIELLAKNTVSQHVRTQLNNGYKISISVHSLDPRIDISPCESALIANILENNNSRNINVKISCESNTPWSLFVPVKVEELAPVLVTSTNLQKGSVIDQSNTEIKYIDQYKIRGETLTHVTPILGGKLSRNLRSGAPLYRQHVCLVCKGESVVIMAKSAAFQIRTEGISLSDGSIGEQVRVKNTRSGKIISAKVETINKVSVNL